MLGHIQRTLILGLATLFLFTGCSGGEMAGSGNSYRMMKKKGSSDPGKNPKDPNDGDNGLDVDNNGKTYLTKPKFAMMARDLRCGMCHLKINGDIVSAEDVMSFKPDPTILAPGSDDHIISISPAGQYNERVNGTWFIKGIFPKDRSKTQMQLTVSGGIKENYTGIEIPPKGFPKLDLATAESVAKGTLESGGNKITGVYTGNLVLDGKSSPIKINGEILVKGDVVISGTYLGQGTIYSTGNIYIAGNIKATNSAFPFPATKDAAMEDGRAKSKSQQYDALALAAKSSIIVGNPRDRAVEITPKKVPPPVDEKNVFSWFPGREGGYMSLIAGKFGMGIKTTIEAFLYSENLIAGKIGSYTINGGLMCDSFHILGTEGIFIPGNNTVNYDYRFAGGLDVLQALNSGFTP